MGKGDGRLRVALVGCGNLAERAYLPVLRSAHRRGLCRLAAVCDIDASLLARRVRQFGPFRTYTDIRRMLEEEDLDGVFLVVPTSAMYEVASLTLRRGVPTYLEKPPGRTVEECRKLVRLAATGCVPNQVAFNRRYAPPLAVLKERLLRFGPIHSASAVMYRYRRLERGFAFGTAIHAVDALRYLAGEVVRARPRIAHLPGGRTRSLIVEIEYQSGGMGTLEILPDVGVRMERYVAHSSEATGLAGLAGPGSCVDYPGRVEVYHKGEAVKLPSPFGRRRPVPLVEAAGFRAEIHAFLDALRRGAEPSPSLAESLPSLQIAQAIAAGRTYRKRP